MAELLDHGQHPPQLLLHRDGPGAGAGGLPAHVDDGSPLGDHVPAVGHGRPCVEPLPTV